MNNEYFISSKIFNKKICLTVSVVFIIVAFFIGSNLPKNNSRQIKEKTPKTILIRLNVDFSGNFVSYDLISEEKIMGDIDKLLPSTKYDLNSTTYNVLSYIPKQEKVILYRGVDGTEILLDAYVFDIKTGSVKKLNNSAISYVFRGYGDYVTILSPDGGKMALNNGETVEVYDFLNDKELKLVKTDDAENQKFFPFERTYLTEEEGGNFKWLNENLLQYPVYVKVGDIFKLEKIETVEAR